MFVYFFNFILFFIPLLLLLFLTLHYCIGFAIYQHESATGFICSFWSSLVTQMVKNLPARQETWICSLCQEDLLGKGMATHSGTLA